MDNYMEFKLRTIAIKAVKNILFEVIILLVYLLIKSTDILDLFSNNIDFITLNVYLMFNGIAIALLLLFIFCVNDVNSIHDLLKKHFHYIQLLVGIIEVICIYKCNTVLQICILIFETFITLFLLDIENSKIYKYGFGSKTTSYSNYVEKPVYRRDKLTRAQIVALDELKQLLDKRKSTDSFNVALIGTWGAGKTSITDTLIGEFEKEKQYFILKIGTLTLRQSSNVVTYVRNYFENLFRSYEIVRFGDNVAFLSSLVNIITNSKSFGEILGTANNTAFLDLEKEKELLTHQVSKLLEVSGRKNVLLFIDDTDRCDDEDQIIKMLLEFASIDGIISIISLDKSRDTVIREKPLEGEMPSVYNKLDKYIHVRIRMEDDNHIEYDQNITQQLIHAYKLLNYKERCYISCDRLYSKISLFDELRDYPTTEINDVGGVTQGSSNVLTEILFENLIENGLSFGEYLDKLMTEYFCNTSELSPYIKEMISLPKEQWDSQLYSLSAQWTNFFGIKEFDWLMRLQSNSSLIFWTLRQLYESIDMVKNNVDDQKDIFDILDVYEYYMINTMPIPGRTWENRKDNPVVYSGIDQIKSIVFDEIEFQKINAYISANRFDDVKNLLIEKIRKVINLFYESMILSDFMLFLRGVLNNNRTFKMQLREAELSEQNYLDYIIKEWQSSNEVNNRIEKIKEEFVLLKEINTQVPTLTTIINNVLFANYIYRFGKRFANAELKDSRLFLSRGEKRLVICITRKNQSLNDDILLDFSGEMIKDMDEDELSHIAIIKRKIWED